jgi:capsular exopolysaccharide synthesis family protein
LDKRLEAKISENLEKLKQGEIFRVMDPANYPLIPIGPNRLLILFMGIMVAGAGGIGFVYLRERVDQSITTQGEFLDAVGIPMLVSIPHQPMVRRSLPSRALMRRSYPAVAHNPDLLMNKFPVTLFEQYRLGTQNLSLLGTEQFRVLHASLERWERGKDCKVFCITSAVPGEGKTFTAVNLALVMARDFGKKTLLMDVDCNGATLSELAEQENLVGAGWADVVTHKVELAKAPIPCMHEKLFLLKTGMVDQSPSGLIAMLGSSNLLEDLRRDYDYIVMDAPPILPIADMRFIEELVDGMIVVVRADVTSRDQVVKACGSLEQDKIVGGVLNDVKLDFVQHYGKYYDHYIKFSKRLRIKAV